MQPLSMLRSRVPGVALVLVLVQIAFFGAWAEPLENSEDVPPELEDMETLDLTTPLPTPDQESRKPKLPIGPKSGVSTDWNARAGVDYRKSSIPAAEFKLDQLVAGAVVDQSTGVAWANLSAPGLPLAWDTTIVDTRVDPAQEEGKVAATLSRSVPIGDGLSLTLQNNAAMTRTLADGSPATHASQSWASSQALRFNILPTDTTVALDASRSSADDKWLRSLGAEQKLFGGPLNLTGTVSETAAGAPSKSLKAGFKTTW